MSNLKSGGGRDAIPHDYELPQGKVRQYVRRCGAAEWVYAAHVTEAKARWIIAETGLTRKVSARRLANEVKIAGHRWGDAKTARDAAETWAARIDKRRRYAQFLKEETMKFGLSMISSDAYKHHEVVLDILQEIEERAASQLRFIEVNYKPSNLGSDALVDGEAGGAAECVLIGGDLPAIYANLFGRAKKGESPGARHRFISAACVALGLGPRSADAIDKARSRYNAMKRSKEE